MPFDSSMISQGQHSPSLLERLQQVQQMGNMMQQGRIQRQVEEENQMKIDQMKQALKDEEAARQIFSSESDPEVAKRKLVAQLGPKAFPMLESLSKRDKAVFEANEAQSKAAAAHLGQLSDAIDEIELVKPELREQAYRAKVGALVQAGVIPRQMLSQIPTQYDPEIVPLWGSSIKQQKQRFDERERELKSQREAAAETRAQGKYDAELPGLKAESTLKQKESEQGGKPQNHPITLDIGGQPTPGVQRIMPDGSSKYYANGQEVQNPKEYYKPSGVNLYTQNPDVAKIDKNLVGQDYLNKLRETSPRFALRVDAVIDGREPPPSGRAAQEGSGKQLMEAVIAADPTWNAQRAQVRKAFTTGKEGQNIGALNTAIVHLSRLDSIGKALENGSFTPSNEMFNYIKDKFGASTVTNFELLKDAVAGEMAAALKGTATDIEIANMKKSLRAANSPQQMMGVMREGMGILADKAQTYDDRYHAENPDDDWSPIKATAKSVLDKYGIKSVKQEMEGKGSQKGQPSWKYTAKDGKGNFIYSNDGSNWVDASGKKVQ